ncbi:hypothetical protein ACXWTF_12950 [Thiomicrolovo sp. ZZH C-3]
MDIYFAAPTGKRRDSLLETYGDKYGACQTRDVFSTPHLFKKWFFDNGAFSDWKTGKPFDGEKFLKRLEQIENMIAKGEITRPQFVVVPDKVADGEKSLMVSRVWNQTLLREEFPDNNYYLAVQNGMRMRYRENGTHSNRCVEVPLFTKQYDGIFVGGTKEWKYETGARWAALAHEYGVKAHAGGVGSKKAYLWAKLAGFDSVDSGLPMIHPRHLESALNIEKEYAQNLFLRAS